MSCLAWTGDAVSRDITVVAMMICFRMVLLSFGDRGGVLGH